LTPQTRHGIRLAVKSAVLTLLLALLGYWAFSEPRTPLEYLVGGTLATSILIAAAFVQIVKKGYLGRLPKR